MLDGHNIVMYNYYCIRRTYKVQRLLYSYENLVSGTTKGLCTYSVRTEIGSTGCGSHTDTADR